MLLDDEGAAVPGKGGHLVALAVVVVLIQLAACGVRDAGSPRRSVHFNRGQFPHVAHDDLVVGPVEVSGLHLGVRPVSEDADGNVMTQEQADTFIATLP